MHLCHLTFMSLLSLEPFATVPHTPFSPLFFSSKAISFHISFHQPQSSVSLFHFVSFLSFFDPYPEPVFLPLFSASLLAENASSFCSTAGSDRASHRADGNEKDKLSTPLTIPPPSTLPSSSPTPPPPPNTLFHLLSLSSSVHLHASSSSHA